MNSAVPAPSRSRGDGALAESLLPALLRLQRRALEVGSFAPGEYAQAHGVLGSEQ